MIGPVPLMRVTDFTRTGKLKFDLIVTFAETVSPAVACVEPGKVTENEKGSDMSESLVDSRFHFKLSFPRTFL